MRTVISPFTKQVQSEPNQSQAFDNQMADWPQELPKMDPIFAKIQDGPKYLATLQTENQRLTQVNDVAQQRIARLTCQVDELMECLERRNAQVNFLQRHSPNPPKMSK